MLPIRIFVCQPDYLPLSFVVHFSFLSEFRTVLSRAEVTGILEFEILIILTEFLLKHNCIFIAQPSINKHETLWVKM